MRYRCRFASQSKLRTLFDIAKVTSPRLFPSTPGQALLLKTENGVAASYAIAGG